MLTTTKKQLLQIKDIIEKVKTHSKAEKLTQVELDIYLENLILCAGWLELIIMDIDSVMGIDK